MFLLSVSDDLRIWRPESFLVLNSILTPSRKLREMTIVSYMLVASDHSADLPGIIGGVGSRSKPYSQRDVPYTTVSLRMQMR